MSVAEYNLQAEKSFPSSQMAQTETNDHMSCVEARNNTCTDTKISGKDIFRRTRTRDICRIARQLATLLRAGMPLVPALSALVEQLQGSSERKMISLGSRENPLALVMKEVCNSVNTGSALSDALGRHPDVFSNVFVNMVAAGETSGTLEDVFLRLAEMLEKRVHLTNKVKSAIAYPLMMTVVAVTVVVFLLSFVVPSITQIFLEMDRTLPRPTRLLISTSAFMKTYFVPIVIMVCAVFFGIGAWKRTKDGRFRWDRYKLKVPLFGKLFLKVETARLARTLGILLTSGIPILSALGIVKSIVQNSFIAGALDSVKDRVSKGSDIAGAIRKTGLFPPIVIHIMATGQMSGNIENGLMDIADMYDDEVEMTAKTLTSLIEPVILLIMGAVIGFIVLAILLPIFEINQVL
ncbi:MAG: type II secretion system F family protein [Planctomycetes bacterium]|nr:type II secretion system F family protein [Planctomycetota bacterium]MBL7143931.1 type II secretion system F family protein [Phycisphaerae bacterium]